MIKTQGFRKFATLMAIIFGMTMFLAACGTDSSTDEALSQPGDNFIGTYQFDVDPVNETMTITPVASALSNSQISTADGFAVTSKKPSDGTAGGDWAAGVLTANLVVKNKSTAYRMENVSLRIFQSDDVTITTQTTTTTMGTPGNDVIACNQVGNIGVKLANAGCLAAGGPGVTVVGDKGTNTYSATVQANAGQYPQPVKECQWNGAACTVKYRGLRVIGPGNGTTGPSVITQLALGSGITKYKFMTHLYAEKRPADLFADPRYDVGNLSLILKAYEYENVQNPSYDPTKPLTTVKNGQWFALVLAADLPGKKSRNVLVQCENGNATAGCSIAPGAAGNAYDYYLTEDQGNFNARDAKLNWQTLAASNTGFVYIDKITARVQWDPAVLNSNGTLPLETNCCGAEGIRPSSGTNAFVTSAPGNTNMLTIINGTSGIYDPATNPIDVTGSSATNGQSFSQITSQYKYDYAGSFRPFIGDGKDGYGVGEYLATELPADLVAAVIAMHVVGPSGSGATITVSNAANTLINVAVGNGAAIWSADSTMYIQRSNQVGTGTGAPSYPGWPSTLPTGFTTYGYATSLGENNTGACRGMFNDGILGLSIQ